MSDYIDVARSERHILVRRAGGLSLGSAPVNSVLPVISGTATVGQTLSTTTGTWTGSAPITYAYQWKRAGVAIGSAIASTYVLQVADIATLITVTVTATNSRGSASATSAAAGPIAAVGGLAMLGAETLGMAVDFTYSDDTQRVAVKT